MAKGPSIFKKLMSILVPEGRLRIPIIVMWAILFGLGFATIRISNAFSYLSDDPKACVNCHIMTPEYASWMRGSHGRVTVCTDCHVPHDNIFAKYYFKANDGLRHATMFTLKLEPQVIKMREGGIEVVQSNCQRCHINQIHRVSITNVSGRNYKEGTGLLCWNCHRNVPHGRVHSLTSTPHAIVPDMNSAIPEWMKTNKRKNK